MTSRARSPKARRLAVCVLWLTAAASLLRATRAEGQGITVSPAAVYLESRTRTTKLTVYNATETPAEVSVEFAFGYPQSDAEGNFTVDLSPVAPPGEPSAVGWMRAFPRRFVVAPKQMQVVRVIAEPPAGLTPGEYWSRLVFVSRAAEDAVERPSPDLTAQLNVVTRLVTAANYRQAPVTTGVEIARAEARLAGSAIHLDVDLRRTGNAAFLGRLHVAILDANGRTIATTSADASVYRTMLYRLEVAVPPGTNGPLTARLTLTAEREDLPPGAALPIAPVTHTYRVTP
jgi:hypothetical protein